MRIHYLVLLLVTLFWATAFAQSELTLSAELKVKKGEADSLEQVADSLEERAAQLEERLGDIRDLKDDRDDVKEDLEEEIGELHEVIANLRERVEEANKNIRDARDDMYDHHDDIKEMRSEALEDINETRREALEDINESKEEAREDIAERAQRGSFVAGFEYSLLDTDPLRDLVKNDKTLSYASDKFSFSNDNMMMFTLMGYYNLENDVRVGNGLFAGYKAYQSKPFAGQDGDDDDLEPDSTIATLRVIPVYLGFICEKAFVYDPVNFFFGIMVGGNLSIVVKETQPAETASPFMEADDDDDDHDFSVALAPAFSWDVHGGLAFRLAPKFHLGFDGVVRFAYAYQGYGAGFGDFVTVSPGVRLRLTFGNAG